MICKMKGCLKEVWIGRYCEEHFREKELDIPSINDRGDER